MMPAGYLFKSINRLPHGLQVPAHVRQILSVSGCFSPMFADYIDHWLHNGLWLFDSPAAMAMIAKTSKLDLGSFTLFYYEIHALEYHEVTRSWVAVQPDGPVAVVAPPAKYRMGFDVVCHSQRNWPECSPLSCNGVCNQVVVNENCLFETLDDAKRALEQGHFDRTETGPFRIYAVYTVPQIATMP